MFRFVAPSILFTTTYILGAYLFTHFLLDKKNFEIGQHSFGQIRPILQRWNAYLNSITRLVGITRYQLYTEFVSKLVLLTLVFCMASISFPVVSNILPSLLLTASLGFSYWIIKYRNRVVHKYRERFESDFAEFIESLSLAVNSGLPLTTGILRVIDERLANVTPIRQHINEIRRVSSTVAALLASNKELNDPLSRELYFLKEALNRGDSVTRALDQLAIRLNSTAVANLSDAIFLSMSRGTPITFLINNHAESMREARRNKLLERAGRAEVKMMVPVVFLLLPISVLFALWPSFQQLQHLVTIS